MAKLTDDQLRFIIDIEATGAQGQINTLQAEIGKLEKQNASFSASLSKVNSEISKQEKQLAKLEKAGKQNTDEYRKLSAATEQNRQKQAQLSTQLKQNQNIVDSNREKMAQFTASLKLNQMTMQQLRERASQLRRQLDLTSKAASPETYKKLQKELADTTKQIGKLTEKQSTLSSVFKKGSGAVVMGNMLTKGIELAWRGLASAARQAFDVIVDFEKENANLASVLGTTQEGVSALTDDAKRLGAATSYTASQMTQLQTELAKLGFTQTEILQSTEAVQRFATATGASLPEAAQLAGAALRSFGLEADEMERVVSTMAVATSKSALDFDYLQNAMSTIAPVAKSFGFTIEDTTALLGTLANSGFDASSAATATRNILLSLADGSSKLAQRLGEPITSMDQLIPALRKLQEGGVDLAEALELTDKRSVAAFATFLSGTDTLEELRNGITGVNDELRAMEKERLNTVRGSMDLLRSAWDGLLLSMYNSKGVMKDVLDWITGIISNITEFVSSGGIKEWLEYVTGDEETKRGIENRRMLRQDEKDFQNTMTNMRKKSIAEARAYNETQRKNEEQQLAEWERMQKGYEARGDKERADFYTGQIERTRDYAKRREEVLAQMEADELKRQEREQADEQARAKAQAEARRKRAEEQAQEAAKQAKKQEQQSKEQERKRKEQMQQAQQDEQNALKERLLMLSRQLAAGSITQEQFDQQALEERRMHLQNMLDIAREYGESTLDLEQQIVDMELKTTRDAAKKTKEATKKALDEARKHLDKVAKGMQQVADAAGNTLGGELVKSVAQATDAITEFQKKSLESFQSNEAQLNAYTQVVGTVTLQSIQGVSTLIGSIFEAETAALEAEKQKQLSIVGDNAEERERIEQEFAQRELDLQKKQADADAGVKSAQLWVNTAMGIVSAWATGIEQLGVIAGPILASAISAALLATAGIQQAQIIRQRDAIRNTTLEHAASTNGAAGNTVTIRPEYSTGTNTGYADGGYTGDGAVLQPAGTVHRGEYVVSQAEMHNPTVIPMVRAIESERQRRKAHGGTIHASGYADGGYTTANDVSSNEAEMLMRISRTVEAISSKLDKPVRAQVNYQELKDVDRRMTAIQKKNTI